MLFDSHTHLQFPQFDEDREEIIRALGRADIKVINVGTDFKDSKKAVELAKKYFGQMWATVGAHPIDVLNENFDISKYKELAKNGTVVAIGECGLDYYRLETHNTQHTTKTKELQKEFFEKQIELAHELKKPLMIHCRPSAGTQDAYEDVLHILNSYFIIHNSSLTGAAHFFVGSKEIAKQFLDLGFYISFAGPITFVPKSLKATGTPAAKSGLGAEEYREIIEYVPLDKILIETDAPFAAPAPYRGKRNEPAYVEFVARKIAEIKNLDFETVAQQTFENAKKLFNFKF